jgi:hypothetical protein
MLTMHKTANNIERDEEKKTFAEGLEKHSKHAMTMYISIDMGNYNAISFSFKANTMIAHFLGQLIAP